MKFFYMESMDKSEFNYSLKMKSDNDNVWRTAVLTAVRIACDNYGSLSLHGEIVEDGQKMVFSGEWYSRDILDFLRMRGF